jgi:hypothetical protein
VLRIAIVADNHGNLTALEAMHADVAARAERVVCLGNGAATEPQPPEVVARLRTLAWPAVMGNAGAMMLRPLHLAAADPEGRGTRRGVKRPSSNTAGLPARRAAAGAGRCRAGGAGGPGKRNPARAMVASGWQ